MVEVYRRVLVHGAHGVVAKTTHAAIDQHRGQVADPFVRRIVDIEQVIKALDMGEPPAEQEAVPPMPGEIRSHRPAQTDVHISALKQQAAFDQEFFLEVLAQATEKELHAALDEVLLRPDGIEGDIAGDDERRPFRRSNQRIYAVQPYRLAPAAQARRLALGCQRDDPLLEDFQNQGDRRGTLVMLAMTLGGRRENPELPRLVDHAPILDHAAFGEDHDLAAGKDLRREERQKTLHIVRHAADFSQELGKASAAREELLTGQGPAVGAGLLENQVLRDDGLETGEVVEEEYLARLDRARRVVQCDIKAEPLVEEREPAHAPLVSRFTDDQILTVDHRFIRSTRP